MQNNLLPYDGEAYLYNDLLSFNEAAQIYQTLKETVGWRNESIRIFGKTVMQPRLTAWFADEGRSYRYSGLDMMSQDWLPVLLQLKRKVELIAGTRFNSALLNFYRNGSDSVGWHRDYEKELGPMPVIASVSLGVTRKFELRDYRTKNNRISIMLESGSLLLMKGSTQQFWEHRIPKSTGVTEGRINITFRYVVD